MNLFRSEPERPAAINLGRTHEVEAEVHHSGGEDDWWYHGQLWLSETRPVRRKDLDPMLTDPRNRRILWQIRHRWTDEQIAAVVVKEATERGQANGEPFGAGDAAAAREAALSIARDVRLASERANEEHSLRIYGLGTASKTDERILVTIDQDLIAEAPQIPYPQTEKGAKRRQWIVAGFAAAMYGLLIFWTVSALTSVSGAVGSVQSLEAQMVTSAFLVLPFVSGGIGAVAVYLAKVRDIRVLDIQVQPIWPTKVHEHTEAVFLVNSRKRPASHYLTNLFRLSPDAVRALAGEIGTFQTDLISSLQGQASSYRSELDNAEAQLEAERQRKFDRDLLGGPRPFARGTWNAWSFIIAGLVIAVVVGVGVYVATQFGG